jgi:hypothetical protein
MLRLLLTNPPESIVLGEPAMHKDKIKISLNDLRMLEENGVDVTPFTSNFSKKNILDLDFSDTHEYVTFFKNEVVGRIKKKFSQVGIKEIRHNHWKDILSVFPNTKAIITGRDPRDIYLSLYHKKIRVKGKPVFASGVPISAETVADDINREFEYQLKIIDNCESILVRYEDFCEQKKLHQKILEFTNSASKGLGAMEKINRYSSELHGESITSTSVKRWKKEIDEKLIADMNELFARTDKYNHFWGY